MFALLGLIFAYILVCFSSSGSSPYSELRLTHKKEVIEDYLEKRKQELITLINSLKTRDDPKNNGKEYYDSLAGCMKSLNSTIRELVDLKSRNRDTSRHYYLDYFDIERNAFSGSLIDSPSLNGVYKIPIRVSLVDSTDVLSESPRMITDSVFLEKIPYKYKMTFFREHGSFALWAVYSLAAMMIIFLLFPMIWMRFRMNWRELKDLNISIKGSDIWTSLIIVTAGILTFMIVFYRGLADIYLVRDNYFLSSFNARTRLYLMPSYLFSGVYFLFFLLLTAMMLKLKNLEKSDDSPEIKTALRNVRSSFDLSFLCAAVNLSLSVIWMGILYSAINTMEAPQYYTMLTGKPFLSHDLVYLTGLLHSSLLLVFYLPVKWNFNPGKTSEPADAKTPAAKNVLWDAIMQVLVTASPLLSGLLQKLLSNLIG